MTQRSFRRKVRDVGLLVAGVATCVLPDALISHPETYGLRTVRILVSTSGAGFNRTCNVDIYGQMPEWLFEGRRLLGIKEQHSIEYYNKLNNDASLNPKSGWQEVTEHEQPTTLQLEAPEGLDHETPYIQVVYRPKDQLYGTALVVNRPLQECR